MKGGILRIWILLFVLFLGFSVSGQGVFIKRNPLPEFLKGQMPWADSVIAGMTLNEKIGQLFMVAAYSNKDANHQTKLTKLIKEEHILKGL